MTGRIGLHGGAEFLAGDEPFLAALLEAAALVRPNRTLEVVILPAAARENPDQAARTGTSSFARVAADLGIRIETNVARVVDTASAADESYAACLAEAHVIFLPGGDPGLVPAILAGSRAWSIPGGIGHGRQWLERSRARPRCAMRAGKLVRRAGSRRAERTTQDFRE